MTRVIMAKSQSSVRREDATQPATEAIQDYAKAIYALQQDSDDPVSTSALAERLGVAAASVSAMVKRLAELNLVKHEPYKGVSLTSAGEKIALEVMRHHRLLELYLAEAFGMPWDRVHAEAEVLEHHISEELEELIAQSLSNPELDPHGDPIPDRDLVLPSDDTKALADLEPGAKGTFTRVSDTDPEMLRYLAKRDIRPGAKLSVKDKQPFGGPVFVRIAGRTHALGGELARSMRIEVD